MALLGRTLDPRVSLKAELCDGRAEVLAEPELLQTALMNLGINAAHAMPEGGRLSFRSGRVTFVETELIPRGMELAPGAYLSIQVEDTGSGIAEEHLARVFDPFFTTKPTSEGTGLGLAMAYGLASRYGGGLGVESEPGRGACFSLYLPLCPERQMKRPAAAEPRSESRPEPRSKRILVVDDEPGVREVSSGILRIHGHQVAVASGGGEALELMACERFDVVLLDLVMPGMSGEEVFRAIKAQRRGPQVIVSTGYAAPTLLEGLRQHGVFELLEKPYRSADLLSALERACAAVVEARL